MDFIPVLGQDPRYPVKTIMYIDKRIICKIHPIYAVKDEDGKYWRCLPNHEGAEVVRYHLVDRAGDVYISFDPTVLEWFGVRQGNERKLGFVFEDPTDDGDDDGDGV